MTLIWESQSESYFILIPNEKRRTAPMDYSTIAAIATSPGLGGIGIIKISGKDSLKIVKKIFRPIAKKKISKEKLSVTLPPITGSHQIRYGHIVEFSTNYVFDEVLLIIMKGPKSYTREDIVEIHAHSGHIVMKSILELVLRKGARIAYPGEFTKRAFLNGRIDLTQAEAVIDIINAKTESSLNAAISQIRGDLFNKINNIRETVINILSEISAVIDFPDDVTDNIDRAVTIQTIEKDIIQPIKELVKCYQDYGYIREGLKVVIAGGPNVGKSTLMNSLLQKDRSIVTSIPGTTRDVIEDSININGIPVTLIDTAGIRISKNIVENIGIEKAWESINKSDIVLFVVDGSNYDESWLINNLIKFEGKNTIIAINKIDLITKKGGFASPTKLKEFTIVNISALYNKNIELLKNMIVKTINDNKKEKQDAVIPNLRHKKILERCLNITQQLRGVFVENLEIELIAIDLEEIINNLGEIIGINTKVDVLDKIFNDFCIGK